MDHQIVNHAHVERAKGEGRRPRRLDEDGRTGPRRRRLPGGIEPLHVAHGDRSSTATRGDHDRSGVLDASRDRFLDEEVDAGLEERHRDPGVQARRGRDHRRIDVADEIPGLGHRPAAMGGSDAVARLRQRIDDRHEFGIRTGSEQPRMNRPEMPTPNDRHFHPLHAAFLRSRERPCRPCCCRSRNSSNSFTWGTSIPCDRRISRAGSTPTLARYSSR